MPIGTLSAKAIGAPQQYVTVRFRTGIRTPPAVFAHELAGAPCTVGHVFEEPFRIRLTNRSAAQRPDVLLMAEGYEPILLEGAKLWTPEQLTVDWTPSESVPVPVEIWLARPGALAAARDELANANFIHAANRTGIQFEPAYRDVSESREALRHIRHNCETTKVGAAEGAGWFKPNRINVYYVGHENGENEFCGEAFPGIEPVIFINKLQGLGTLVHELGHALGLADESGLPADNIMRKDRREIRAGFTHGQVFRMNFHRDSMIRLHLPAKERGVALDSGQCPPSVPEDGGPAGSPPAFPTGGGTGARKQRLAERHEKIGLYRRQRSGPRLVSTREEFVERYFRYYTEYMR